MSYIRNCLSETTRNSNPFLGLEPLLCNQGFNNYFAAGLSFAIFTLNNASIE